MDIKQALEKDIIDVLYLLKKDMEMIQSGHNWRLPVPDYMFLKGEISQGHLYILRQHNISIGTFSLDSVNDPSKDYQRQNVLLVHRIAIASYWINNETLREIIDFLEKFATGYQFTAIRFHINSNNEKMNTFYTNLNLHFLGEIHYPSSETPYLQYEKPLEVKF